jgi:uncharacterized protein YbjT (DUF2867 family)
MKTLVLGGTGFVGRRLVEILTADGAGVTVLNRGVTPVELPAYVATLAEVVGVEPDVVLLPDDLARIAEGPLFSRLFAPAPRRPDGR